jgi:hypothetical protein
MLDKLNTSDIEWAVALFFNPRINIIIPNISWGLGFNFELDLLIAHHPSYYCTEVEIKITKSDIKADLKKEHSHRSERIRRFFYAVPWYLKDCEYLPSNCGLIIVDGNLRCKIIRPPRINKNARKLTAGEFQKLLELGCMRIWGLKEALMIRRRERANKKNETSEPNDN